MSNVKSIKSAAKEAKLRLKNRFWEDYKKEVDSGVKTAEEEGISSSGVKKYFRNLVIKNLMGVSEEEEKFYIKVRDMLDVEKSLPNDALDKLMDKNEFNSLSYEARERYLFKLAEKYLKAVDRYKKERGIELALGR
ncbi:MAG: hypothetical protein E7360_06125 [Clostridiales bacterium]|nr:hypothetical protein [Clostridiales bacterium]